MRLEVYATITTDYEGEIEITPRDLKKWKRAKATVALGGLVREHIGCDLRETGSVFKDCAVMVFSDDGEMTPL